MIGSLWYALWNVFSPIGSMIGAAIGGWLQDRFGRKMGFTVGGVASVGAVLTLFLSDRAPNRRITFLIGKMAEGTAIGIIIVSTQTYMSEIVPQRLRGPALALFPILLLFGQLVATGVSLGLEGVDSPWSYRIAVATSWPFSIIPILLGILLPESPALLLRREQNRSAWLSFTRLHGETVAAQCQDLFEDIRKAVEEERRKSDKVRYKDCFKGTNLRRTFIVIFANVLPDLFGLTMLGNATYFVQQLGMAHNLSFVIQLVGILFALISNATSFFTLLRFGRRTHILYSMAVVGVLWLAMGIVGVFNRNETAAWVGSVIMILIITIASLGAWPASYVVSSETSALTLRAKTSGVGWFLGGLIRAGFDFGMPYLYNGDDASLDLGGKVGFVFFGTCVIGFAVSWACVPELKGRSPLEADRLFEKKIPAWRFTAPEYMSLGSEDQLGLAATRSSDQPATVGSPYQLGVDTTYGGRSRAGSDVSNYQLAVETAYGGRSRAGSDSSVYHGYEMEPVAAAEETTSPTSKRKSRAFRNLSQ